MQLFIILTFIFFMTSIILSVLYLNKTKCLPNDCPKCLPNDCPKCPPNDCPKCPPNDCSKCMLNGWTQDNIDELNADIISQFSKSNVSNMKTEMNKMSIIGCGDKYSDTKVTCDTLNGNIRDCIIKDFTKNIDYNIYSRLKSKDTPIDLTKYMKSKDCRYNLLDDIGVRDGVCYDWTCS